MGIFHCCDMVLPETNIYDFWDITLKWKRGNKAICGNTVGEIANEYSWIKGLTLQRPLFILWAVKIRCPYYQITAKWKCIYDLLIIIQLLCNFYKVNCQRFHLEFSWLAWRDWHDICKGTFLAWKKNRAIRLIDNQLCVYVKTDLLFT